MPGEAKYDVVLLPTFMQVEEWRKAHALEDGGLFGTTVSTFNAWMADLWEIHGDGRRLVNSLQRAMAMQAAFSQLAHPVDVVAEDAGGDVSRLGGGASAKLGLSPGIAPLAARCEQAGAGVPEFDAAVAQAGQGGLPAGFDAREGLFLAGIARYRRLISGLGLVEPGEACALLAHKAGEVFPRPLTVLVEDAEPLDWRMERFFAACPQLSATVRLAPGSDGVRRLREGVEARFAFPAGRYAVAAMVADLARERFERADGDGPARMVVTSPDPLALYRQLEPAMAKAGIVCAVQAQVRFEMTDFGRVFALVNRLMDDGGWNPATLADILHSPFSGLSVAQARRYDARLRGDRMATREDCLRELCELDGGFADVVALASNEALAGALERAERVVHASSRRSQAWRSEQLAAIAAVRSVREVAQAVPVGAHDMLAVLENTAVTLSFAGVTSDGQGLPQVIVTTQGAAARMGRGSCDAVVLTGLTSADYPLADPDDAATTLFAKLGLAPADDALSRARRTFFALQQLPTCEFICLRPLNDVDGNPAYPSAMLEEFLDAYRDPYAEPGSGEWPEDLAQPVLERGEELLYANAQADKAETMQAAQDTVVPAPIGELSGESIPKVFLPRRLPDGGLLHRSPSPSQIELFLACPYKWFVQRRLGLEGLDEGFGPIEQGTFAHAVLERFYTRFGREVAAKVDASNLEQAKRLLREVADQVEDEMAQAGPGESRLVAASRLERRELAQFKEQLADFLDFEAELLPTFHPAYLEYEFDADNAVEYGGCKIVGKVDRIDVDDAGHAVIIDYKGSINGEQEIADKDNAHVGAVQTRIYAQMVRRTLGLDVVGALYVGYGKRHAAAGALDSRVVEMAQVPGIRSDSAWCALADPPGGDAGKGPGVPFAEMTFTTMLDATEELVAGAVERMARGQVAPNPSSPHACEHCPVAGCPGKGA